VKAQIAESEGEAELQRAHKAADKAVVMAEAQLAQSRRQAEQTIVLAEADSKQAILAGRGEAQRIMQVGLSEAAVLMRKVASYGDPRLYALQQVGAQLARSTQPLVPERVFIAGGGDGSALTRSASDGANGNGDSSSNGIGNGHPFVAPATSGLVGLLLQTLLAERTTFNDDSPELSSLKELASRMTEQAMQNMQTTPVDPKVLDAKSLAASAK
jgi:hypothetical protein